MIQKDRRLYIDLAKETKCKKSRRIYLFNYNRLLQMEWKKAAALTATR